MSGGLRLFYQDIAPDFASLFVAGAFEGVRKLADFPDMGRIVPEIGDASIRELPSRQYRVIYVVDDETVEILTLYHASRAFGGFG